MRLGRWFLGAVLTAGFMLSFGPSSCQAQTADQRIDQATDRLLSQGEWDAAVDAFSRLLESDPLSAQQRKKVCKFLAIGHVFRRPVSGPPKEKAGLCQVGGLCVKDKCCQRGWTILWDKHGFLIDRLAMGQLAGT